ncbi:hypothetical protein [Staphylococcus aureus]|nr:hypothetical protein [Staphylococcus aureus]
MTQVHLTLKSEEIQSIIEYSVKDDVSSNIGITLILKMYFAYNIYRLVVN